MKRTDGSSSNDDAPRGAPASLPYDRTTVERFQKSFPRARWPSDAVASPSIATFLDPSTLTFQTTLTMSGVGGVPPPSMSSSRPGLREPRRRLVTRFGGSQLLMTSGSHEGRRVGWKDGAVEDDLFATVQGLLDLPHRRYDIIKAGRGAENHRGRVGVVARKRIDHLGRALDRKGSGTAEARKCAFSSGWALVRGAVCLGRTWRPLMAAESRLVNAVLAHNASLAVVAAP